MPFASIVKPVALLLILVAIWQLSVDLFGIQKFLLPSPWDIAQKFAERPERLAHHSLVTLTQVLLGFGLAVVVGIGIATAIVHSRLLAESLYPLLVISQVTPQIAVAPILVIWFGSGEIPKILVAFLVAFFPMVVNTAAGLLRVQEDLIDLMRGLRASRFKIFWMIRLPNALPNIFAGARISATLAVIGAVVGEFVAASEGLGYLVFTGTANNDTTLTFAAVVLLAAMGLALFSIVTLAQRVAVPWASQVREGDA